MRGFPPAGVSALAKKRRGPRAAAAWQKAAAAEIATNWGGCKWGDARRFRVQPVAPGQAPQGDQAAVGNAAEQEPAAPAAPASEGRSGGSGSHPVAAGDGPQGDGKPVAPGQAPQGDQASVGNVAEPKVGSPAALASTARSSSEQNLIVLSRISGGSYGDVFKATWKGRTVAVKVTSKTRSSEATKGTTQTRELTMLKSFLTSELAPACPHIVRLLGWSETAFDLRFHLEYIPLSLRTCIKQADMLACEVWDLAEGISKGVDFLHARSILHRDLKPANILVKTGAVPSACGSGLRAVICDFGLARNISDCLPASGQRRADAAVKLNLTPNVCTLYYRAPEIMKTLGKYGFPSDVWSTGCVFVEMVLRRPAFAANDEKEHWAGLKRYCLPPEGSKFSVSPELKNYLSRSQNSLLREGRFRDDCVLPCLAWDPAKRPSAQGLTLRILEHLPKSASGAGIRAAGGAQDNDCAPGCAPGDYAAGGAAATCAAGGARGGAVASGAVSSASRALWRGRRSPVTGAWHPDPRSDQLAPRARTM